MKVEIGGGDRPRGDDWVNVDIKECADVQHDLCQYPWPFATNEVDELYSAHCIEHLPSPQDFVREVARICRVGAAVEIRCPDVTAEMAMCAGHLHVFSIEQVRHMDHVFPEMWWEGSEKRLSHVRTEQGCDDYWFPKARKSHLFSTWTDEEILTWLPRTCHENRFHFVVVRNEM